MREAWTLDPDVTFLNHGSFGACPRAALEVQSALRAQMEGRDERFTSPRRHDVVLFRDRDEYVAKLREVEPQIGVSLGYYAKAKRTAFFYVGDETLVSTWYHEAAWFQLARSVHRE